MTEPQKIFPNAEASLDRTKRLLKDRLADEGVDYLLTEEGELLVDMMRVLDRSRLAPGLVYIDN